MVIQGASLEQLEKQIIIISRKLQRSEEERLRLEQRINKQAHLTSKIEIQKNEIESLSHEKLSLINKINEEQRKILDMELENARIVQRTLLPDMVSCPAVDISSYYKASQNAGGDWFNYWYIPHSKTFWCFMIDVTGHGMASSLITGVCSGAIRALILNVYQKDFKNTEDIENYLVEITDRLNTIIYETGGRVGRLLTMLALVIDCTSGDGVVLNAGHRFALLKSQSCINSIMANGNFIGFNLESNFSCKKISLKHEDEFFIYTDGLVENGEVSGREIKIKELKFVMNSNSPLHEKKSQLEKIINVKWRPEDFEDDVSFLIGRYNAL